ncbi:galactokinase [Pseudoflavonifractor sp. MSJ-30]|uniref:galactokinase n=1 Tax=Pseudoflavonifractor sp. MSJ-30 TaxID=2841525 RepID=UPI001C10396D|nr:galactokinase family protein [Pseudoflavonifractor sp. MSJ-30]MBU5453582.1 galactokinase [Pseudoflavonifractor sp. MSJ-30]
MSSPSLILSRDQKQVLDAGFFAAFEKTPERYFSAPGRTEIGGNHTDHQRGRVLAAAVNLDTRAAVRVNGTDTVRILSKGYPLCTVSLNTLVPQENEINTTPALVRGVCARFAELGCKVEGFDAYCESTVLPGSGLSSSAAFEVLIGTIVNHLFFGGRVSQPEIAQIGQYAENVFFGKPCGLMDQTASAVGNLVTIDFFDKDHPVIEPVDFDFSACGHALCIIDSQASHADLTDEYAAIPGELKQICAYFGKEVLTQISEADFFAAIPALRKICPDRAVLRAIHFYQENARVPQQVEALRRGDFAAFLELVKQSGYSSYMYLQNVIPAGYVEHQDVAVSLALCEHYLRGKGAYRVHGGGFAGTVQAFVPFELLDSFRAGIDAVLGQGACHVLSIRPQGGVEMEVEA